MAERVRGDNRSVSRCMIRAALRSSPLTTEKADPAPFALPMLAVVLVDGALKIKRCRSGPCPRAVFRTKTLMK